MDQAQVAQAFESEFLVFLRDFKSLGSRKPRDHIRVKGLGLRGLGFRGLGFRL